MSQVITGGKQVYRIELWWNNGECIGLNFNQDANNRYYANRLLLSDTLESILRPFSSLRGIGALETELLPVAAWVVLKEPPPVLTFALACPVMAAPTADRPVP
jgi:hypothetical protein